MNICQIGIISFEDQNTNRELKSVGGIQGYISELVKYLNNDKVPLIFVGKIYNYIKINNFKYHQIIKNPKGTNAFLINLFIRSFFIKLPEKTVIQAHRSDHFIAFSAFRNNPSVITLHGQQAKIINDRKGLIVRTIYAILERLALKKVNLIIAVDKVTRDFYIKRYSWCKEKIRVIPTGVNTDVFKPLNKSKIRAKMGFDNKAKIISYVGRIEQPKMVDDIIRAFRLLHQKDNSYKLVIVGDGVDMHNIKILVRTINLEDSIFLLGIRKRNELPEIFNLSDVSVLYSKNEGSPLSVKESLACGIPVVSNDVGDVSEVISNDYNGYILKKDNIEELAQTLELAIKNAGKMKNNCVSSIAAYSSEKVNKKVLDLYKLIQND